MKVVNILGKAFVREDIMANESFAVNDTAGTAIEVIHQVQMTQNDTITVSIENIREIKRGQSQQHNSSTGTDSTVTSTTGDTSLTEDGNSDESSGDSEDDTEGL